MSNRQRKFGVMAILLILVGFGQSWSLSLTIVNLCIISAVMALGVNIQWGYAGLFNAGVMGFAALGGVTVVLVSIPPVRATWSAGGGDLMISVAVVAWRKLRNTGLLGMVAVIAIAAIGFFAARAFFLPGVDAIESIEPAKTGYLGGLGLPIILAWPLGGVLAAGAAWIVARVSLGLRSDYLAIATLGISEIIVAILKNEDWLTRGVKNVVGLPRPTPYEIDLQKAPWFIDLADTLGVSVVEFSSIFVKLCFTGLFLSVLLILLFFAERALRSPWGRMMRAIRDNETAANAMGKDVTGRHREVFILGSAVIGIAGAMLVTLDGQFTPTTYQPLRFTFLIWVMVIVGGSGNNYGAIIGGFIVWFVWVEAEPVGRWLIEFMTSGMAVDSAMRLHLIDGGAYMRPITMGAVLLLVLRFAPKGLIPEESGRTTTR